MCWVGEFHNVVSRLFFVEFYWKMIGFSNVLHEDLYVNWGFNKRPPFGKHPGRLMERIRYMYKSPNVQHCCLQPIWLSWLYYSTGAMQFFCLRGFSWGTGGSPHPVKILSIPPHPTLVPIFGPRLVPPAEVRPQKFEKFKYILVPNLTTFKLKSTLKSCISCLK